MARFSLRPFPPRGRWWLFTIVSTMMLLVLTSMTPTIINANPSGTNAQTPIARATAIVNQMTLDEKILEVHGVGGTTPNLRIVPGISRLNIPEFVITNGSAGVSYGTITPRQPATALPAPLALAATWDPTVANTYGTVIGKEARAIGNDLLEGPDMNLARVPQGGRTFENFGEDPYLAGQIAAYEIMGIQSQGEIAEAKHYAGNEQELNRQTTNDVIDERTLRELYLVPFEYSVKQGKVGAVMCAYPSVNGQYACENKILLHQILKGEWGFSGFVTTDFGAAHSTVATALDGVDLEMAKGVFFGSALKAAVQAGTVPMSVLDDKLIRRFAVTMQMGLWDNPPVAGPVPSAMGTADGIQARNAAEAAMVLLKNSTQQLPLNASKLHTIAVIGQSAWAANPKTGGGGTAGVHPIYSVTPIAGLQNRVGSGVNITYDDGSNLTTTAAVAKAADVAIVMVGDARKEGTDFPISLSGNQDAMVSAVASANKNTVVVIKSGSVVLMPWVNQVSSILEAWYPGEEDGNAVASVLFGDTNPSGKLPITFPQSVSDLPANTPAQYPGVNGQVSYSEGLDMGYRYYDAKNITPLFPFGFGLSYTNFAYTNLKVTAGAGSTATVTFDVTNTGSRAGAEVAQVYVGMPSSAGEPPKQLKGFQKLSLAAGATGHASISLDARAFEYWNTSSHAWTVAPGTYQIMVGSSSRDILLQGSLALNSTPTPTPTPIVTPTVTPTPAPAGIYQAEDATLSGPLVLQKYAGYTGTGYADYQNASGDYVQWSVNVATAGIYTLTFRYSNGGTTDRPLSVTANGVVVQSSLSFPGTGGWGSWKTVSLTATLKAGNNTIRSTSIGQNGGNIDYLSIT